MGKFSNVYNRPEQPVVPDSSLLNAELNKKGIPTVEDTFSAVRANAEADIPENKQSSSSAYQGSPSVGGEEGSDTEREYSPSPYQDASKANDPASAMDPETGAPMAADVLQKQNERERLNQEARARGVNIDWATREEFEEAFPEVYKESAIGPIHWAKNEIFERLTESKVDDTSQPGVSDGMKHLSAGLNRNPAQVATTVTMALAMLAPMLHRQKAVSSGDTSGKSEIDIALDFINSVLSADGLGDAKIEYTRDGVVLESAVHILGRLIKQLSKVSSSADANGFPIDPRTQPPSDMDTNKAGGIGLQAILDSDLLTVYANPESVQFLRIHPSLGTPFVEATRDLQKHLTGLMSGRSQTVPVSDTGEYIGASRNVRRGDIHRPGYTKLDRVVEVQRIIGSIGLKAEPDKAFFGALFSGNMLNQLTEGITSTPFNTLPIYKINSDSESYLADGPLEVKNKVSIDETARGNASAHLKEGALRYSKSWMDYTTQRQNLDANDVNPQRNKWQRAVYGGASIPMKPMGSLYKTGVSHLKASGFWTGIGEKVKRSESDMHLVGEERELGFLLTLGHAMNIGKTVGKETGAMTPVDILKTVTPEFLHKAAHTGAILKSIIPEDENGIFDILSNPTDFNIHSLEPAQVTAIETLLDNSDRETWGYVLQGYLDANEYVNASKNGTAFTPKVTTAIDMNSAGRGFLANDIGNRAVLERVGLIWEMYVDQELQSTQPFGNPRNYYVKVALTETIDSALGSSRVELASFYKDLFKKYGSPAFFKSFAKAVLLQTDYGKATQFHRDNVAKFLEDNPKFAKEVGSVYKDLGSNQMITDLNAIHTHTLRKATDVWQQEVPKSLVRLCQMSGTTLSAEGYYGEGLGLGSFVQKETGQSVEITGRTGDKQRIDLTARMFDYLAAAADKKLIDEKGDQIEAPGPGTAAVNQIGPILGQYRESIVIGETYLHINGGKKAENMLWAMPIYDNFVLNSDSFAQFYYVANNIVVPKVLSWDIQRGIVSSFQATIAKTQADVVREGVADIGSAGKYHGMQTNLDLEYKYLMNPKDGKLSQRKKDFLAFLQSPSSGYIPPSASRGSSNPLTPNQYRIILANYMKFKFVRENINKWLDFAPKRKMSLIIADLARRGLIAFMT